MKFRNLFSIAGVVFLSMIYSTNLSCQESITHADVFMEPERLVRGLYAAVTFEPGTTPDWDYVRKFFIPEAVFAVRMTPTSMEVIDLEDFVEWFISDIEEHKMKERGFEENIQKMKMTEFGDMAHCFVVYQARFKTPAESPGQLGLDSFGLMKKDGRWWIVSITNDIVSPGNPLPEELT